MKTRAIAMGYLSARDHITSMSIGGAVLFGEDTLSSVIKVTLSQDSFTRFTLSHFETHPQDSDVILAVAAGGEVEDIVMGTDNEEVVDDRRIKLEEDQEMKKDTEPRSKIPYTVDVPSANSTLIAYFRVHFFFFWSSRSFHREALNWARLRFPEATHH